MSSAPFSWRRCFLACFHRLKTLLMLMGLRPIIRFQPFIFVLQNFKRSVAKYSSHLACGFWHPDLSSSFLLLFALIVFSEIKWQGIEETGRNKRRSGIKKSSNLFSAQVCAIFIQDYCYVKWTISVTDNIMRSWWWECREVGILCGES